MNPDRWQQLDELFHAALGIHYSVDRKSTRLNSSHDQISYAVFCLKKKKTRMNSSHYQISYAVFCLKKKDTCDSLIGRRQVGDIDAASTTGFKSGVPTRVACACIT